MSVEPQGAEQGLRICSECLRMISGAALHTPQPDWRLRPFNLVHLCMFNPVHTRLEEVTCAVFADSQLCNFTTMQLDQQTPGCTDLQLKNSQHRSFSSSAKTSSNKKTCLASQRLEKAAPVRLASRKGFETTNPKYTVRRRLVVWQMVVNQ